jgi:hypothetical protein
LAKTGALNAITAAKIRNLIAFSPAAYADRVLAAQQKLECGPAQGACLMPH